MTYSAEMLWIADSLAGRLRFDPGSLNNRDVAIQGHIRESINPLAGLGPANVQQKMQVGTNALTPGFKLDLAPFLSAGMVFVRLALNDANGRAISDNLYWLGGGESSYRPLNWLPPASVSATATAAKDGDEIRIHVQLENHGTSAALANKLTLETISDGARILPAYLSDNYVSLLPGESRATDIEYPASAAPGATRACDQGMKSGCD